MNIKIREASVTEIEILLQFEQGIILAERPYDDSLKQGEIHYYDLIEFIKSENAQVVVAEDNGLIVGSGYAKIIDAKPYQKFNQYAYLGFMFVKEDYRGQGINQLILAELINWAKNKNLTEVRLEVYEENLSAKKAYLKHGFKPNLLEMRLPL